MKPDKNIELKKWYIERFADFEQRLNGESESEFHKSRKEAITDFEGLKFPTLKTEEWKYTNISPLLKEKFTPAMLVESAHFSQEQLSQFCFDGFDCNQIVFVNGHFSEELSLTSNLPANVYVGSLRKLLKEKPESVRKFLTKAIKKKSAFNTLNTAYSLDGAAIVIPNNVVVETPIQLVYLNGSKDEKVLTQPRNIIVAGENSQVKIISNYAGLKDSVYFTNSVTEVFVGKNGIVELYKIQNESNSAFHISETEAVQQENSQFTHFCLSLGGKITRNDINSKLDGEQIETNLFGLYLANENRHVDTHTFLDHAKPNCNSNELYKGILDDNSRGVFSGKILVRQDAQKTNAFQSNKNVLLSKQAHVDTQPQLEIFADDVKCSHGATIGHLDENAYFYIRSRGIPAQIANSMMIRAFANDVIAKVKIEPLREKLNHLIFGHLHRDEI